MHDSLVVVKELEAGECGAQPGRGQERTRGGRRVAVPNRPDADDDQQRGREEQEGHDHSHRRGQRSLSRSKRPRFLATVEEVRREENREDHHLAQNEDPDAWLPRHTLRLDAHAPWSCTDMWKPS